MTDSRLDPNAFPTHYHIIIKPNGDIFGGICYVTFQQTIANDSIILNAANLQIVSASINETDYANVTYITKQERIKLQFKSLGHEGTLKINYIGKIRDDMLGVYKSFRGEDVTISTQFQPHYARSCFPCFDEPNFKATFQFEIFAEKSKTVLSNTHEISQRVYDDYVLHTFAITPRMSTYIVAFYIGTDTFVENIVDGVAIRVYSYKDPQYSQFALCVASKSLEFMTSYFGIAYPLKKMDLISVPRFMAGAMENWGLIIFSEPGLLCNDSTTPVDKMNIAITTCHEIAHQWFGNLVTMEWWSDLWLNESFATWMSWETLNNIFPQWNTWEHYYKKETTDGFELDGMACSHSICSDIVETDKIIENFDDISYAKGSNIIRLVIKLIGQESFQQGINYYLLKYSYKNATTNNLWECLEHISHKLIKTTMDSWLNRKNYPCVYVDYYFLGRDTYLEIVQESFAGQDAGILWSIPLTDNLVMHERKMIVSREQFLSKMNKDVWGFYRIRYSKTILLKLFTERFASLSIIDLTGMISDLFALLKTDKIKLDEYFMCLGCIINNIVKLKLSSIHLFLHTVCEQFYYTKYVNNSRMVKKYQEILSPHVTSLAKKYSRISSDDLNETLAQISLYRLMCGLNMRNDDIPEYFEKRVLDDMTIASFSEAIVTDNKLFDILYETVQWNAEVISVLGFTGDCDRYFKTLDLMHQNFISDRNLSFLFHVAGKNSHLNKHLYPYIKKNWPIIWNIYKSDYFGLVSIIKSLEYIVNKDVVDDMKIFFVNVAPIQNAIKKVSEKIIMNERFVCIV